MLDVLKAAVLGSAVLLVVGCASTGTEDGAGEAGAGTGAGSDGSTYGVDGQGGLSAEQLAAEEAARAAAEQERLLSMTTFYFDFDQSSVKPEARAALEAHAKVLAENGGNVVLQGHADERGTREYNLALGERRAEAVARYLQVLGVSSQQIETVSYGEERPVSLGNDESSWSQNRRVELKYQ